MSSLGFLEMRAIRYLSVYPTCFHRCPALLSKDWLLVLRLLRRDWLIVSVLERRFAREYSKGVAWLEYGWGKNNNNNKRAARTEVTEHAGDKRRKELIYVFVGFQRCGKGSEIFLRGYGMPMSNVIMGINSRQVKMRDNASRCFIHSP